MKNKIKISIEKRNLMLKDIKIWFSKERDEDLGDLSSNLILDFFIEKLAPEIYNQGVYDSHEFLADKVEDLLGIQK